MHLLITSVHMSLLAAKALSSVTLCPSGVSKIKVTPLVQLFLAPIQ